MRIRVALAVAVALCVSGCASAAGSFKPVPDWPFDTAIEVEFDDLVLNPDEDAIVAMGKMCIQGTEKAVTAMLERLSAAKYQYTIVRKNAWDCEPPK